MNTRTLQPTPEHSSGDRGYTILEVVVALALLVTVLVPASVLVVHFMTWDTVSSRMEAVALGQSVMEQAIGEGTCAAAEAVSESGRWIARRTAEIDDRLCTLDVQVLRARNGAVAYQFTTKRLMR